ncbi:hypothetical protein LP418_17680 [Nocardioides sp. B-3]|nr:hypothetical protein LP418_17680 [Nocardioides sp. B-3]
MFVVRPAVLLDLLAQRDPDFAAALRGIAEDPSTPGRRLAEPAEDRRRPRGGGASGRGRSGGGRAGQLRLGRHR